MQGYNGAAVVLDPHDGSVLAMVSTPSYDNNLFVGGISSKDYNELLNNPNRPLYNRASYSAYPPASTVKPFISVAALQEKVITPTSTILILVIGFYLAQKDAIEIGYAEDMVQLT